MRMRRSGTALAGLLSLIALSLGAPAHAGEHPDMVADLQRMIPLHDGIHLSATIFHQRDPQRPSPVVLRLTPYTGPDQDLVDKFVAAGYVFVSVDVRGRGDSEGVFRPLRDAGPDGAEVVEWLAKQPWCNGRVAMVGSSYNGMVQWQVLAQHPRHLAAIIPGAPVYPGNEFPNWKGVMESEAAQWLAFVSGRVLQRNLYNDGSYWQGQDAHLYETGAPFASLAPLAGDNQPVFEEWLQHPGYDAYWAAYNPDPKAYAWADIPILTLTGYFDDEQPGVMRYYREFSRSASKTELEQFYILVGPWDHGFNQKQVAGLNFPDSAVLDPEQVMVDWLDWVLRGRKRPEVISDRVNYYVPGPGAEQWRHVGSLQALSDHVLKFYLSSVEGPASDVFHSGDLITALPQDVDADTLRDDPKDRDGLVLDQNGDDATKQVDAFRKDVLVYQSAPLDAPMTLAGAMKFTGSFSLDTPDADIEASVYAVLPDGSSIRLGVDYVRARFRYGTDHEQAVTPGKIEPYVFDGFNLTSRRLPAGTRIRLVLSPLATPSLERNDNTGGPLGVNPTDGGRVATISLHLDAAHPSFLELPLAKD